jgi:DNA polymerase-3 subunit delta
MQLKGEQLPAHLERDLRPVYVVYGDEPLLVIEAADAIRAAARRRGFDERDVLTALPGFNWVALHHAAGNMSLFGGRTLIDLRIPTGKPGREGGAAIQEYCSRPSPDALLLVTLPGLDWSEEKAAWLKALGEAGVAVKLIPPTLAELPNWLAGRLRRQQQSAARDGLRFIADRVEGNLLAAHQEILKLGLLYPAGELTLQQVQEAVLNVARYDLDGLREALLAGDVARMARTLDGLRQEGEAPPLVLWAMTEEVRALALVKAGLEARQPLDMLLKEARVWGARQALFKSALKRLDGIRANAALAHAAGIDRLVKGSGTGDVWDEFLRLGLSIGA